MATANKAMPSLDFKGLYRFLQSIDIGETALCWPWAGEISKNGYGVFYYRQKIFLAHRLAYSLHYGKDPGELLACHHCDNRKCANPNHLFLGTSKDNQIDKVQKNRHNIRRGSESPLSKLNEEKVLEIRDLLSRKELTNKDIGKMYAVSPACIDAILRNRTWKHVKNKEMK